MKHSHTQTKFISVQKRTQSWSLNTHLKSVRKVLVHGITAIDKNKNFPVRALIAGAVLLEERGCSVFRNSCVVLHVGMVADPCWSLELRGREVSSPSRSGKASYDFHKARMFLLLLPQITMYTTTVTWKLPPLAHAADRSDPGDKSHPKGAGGFSPASAATPSASLPTSWMRMFFSHTTSAAQLTCRVFSSFPATLTSNPIILLD